MEGQRIYNALRGISSRGVNVITTVNGQAASMGSVILMAGDQRKMTNGSRIMIHEASMTTRGDADQLKRHSQLLESISAEIAEVYAERSNGSAEEIRELMRNETWMTAGEAEKAGFIDTIIKDGKESDASNKLKPRLFQTHNTTTTQEMKNPFTPDAELTAKLEVANTENTELSAKITEYEEVMKTDAQNIATLQADKAEMTSKLTDAEKAVTDLTAELTESKGKQDEFDAKVSTSAAAMVAALGHPQIDAEGKDKDLNPHRDENATGADRIANHYKDNDPTKKK
jgi:enoyl-CoA hydratase/carnithine racemase